MSKVTGIYTSKDKTWHMVSLSLNKEEIKIDDLHSASINDENFSEVIKKYALNGEVITALHPDIVSIRNFSLPFMKSSTLKKALSFELENLIHNYSQDKWLLDYYIFTQSSKHLSLLAFAAPKESISNFLNSFQEYNIIPSLVDFVPLSILNILQYTYLLKEYPDALMIFATQDTFVYYVISEGKLHNLRTMHADLWAIEPDLILSDIERTYITSPNIKPPSVLFYIKENDIPVSFLTKLEKKFSVELKAISLREIFLLSDINIRISPNFIISIGLALKGAGYDFSGINFRQEEFAYTRPREILKKRIMVLFSLAAIFSLLVFIYFFNEKNFWEKQHNVILKYNRAKFRKINETFTLNLDTKFIRPDEYFKKLFSLYERIKQRKIKSQEHPVKISALEIMVDIFATFKQLNTKYLKVYEVSIGILEKKVSIRGEIDRNVAPLLTEKLKRIPYFKNIDPNFRYEPDKASFYIYWKLQDVVKED